MNHTRPTLTDGLVCVAALLVVALALMGLVWLFMGLAVALEVQP